MGATSCGRLSLHDIRGEDVYEQLQRGRSDYLETQKYRIRSMRMVHPDDGDQGHLGRAADSNEASTDVRLDDWH